MSKKLTLIRHGKTGYSGRYIGSRDVSLSSAGRQQIEDIRSYFVNRKELKIIASPMLRCRQSCGILFPEQKIVYDDELREVDFGRWEGLTLLKLRLRIQTMWMTGPSYPEHFCFPEGECVDAFLKRVGTVGEKYPFLEQDIIIIAHGGVIRALLCYFLKLDPSKYLLFQVEKGRFTTLNLFPEGAVLTGLNLGVK